MSILQSYPKGTPKKGDYIIGTSMPPVDSDEMPTTRNFSVSSIAAFANPSVGYSSYVALITQVNTDAPTAKILQNTTGATLTWARTSAGIFTVTSNISVFTADKTIVFANCGDDNTASGDPDIIWARTSNTVLTITASAGLNSVLTDGSFEVRIYS
tara:strand:+ start:102 stop:569 length:468 start_codon:yes stop_codon:yes gene_type:complete